MKHFILSVAVLLCAASVSAQNRANTVTDASHWALGLRTGSGVQLQTEFNCRSQNYFETRLGLSWCNEGTSLMAELAMLYNWRIATMDWTPKAGKWFFDAGIGAGIGGRAHYIYFGAAGAAKFGIKFRNAPFKLAVDWTPYIGPSIAYNVDEPIIEQFPDPENPSSSFPVRIGTKKTNRSSFNKYGLANFGLSCVYCF